jgi:predicted transposase YdaD
MEAIMHESSVIQHFLQQGIEQGIEQGTRESLIEGILENLEVRFHSTNLQAIALKLERIEVLQRLRQLRRASLQAPSLDTFQQTLDLNEDTDETDSI